MEESSGDDYPMSMNASQKLNQQVHGSFRRQIGESSGDDDDLGVKELDDWLG